MRDHDDYYEPLLASWHDKLEQQYLQGTKFGGYFTTVDACKELCTNFYSYGLLPCYG